MSLRVKILYLLLVPIVCSAQNSLGTRGGFDGNLIEQYHLGDYHTIIRDHEDKISLTSEEQILYYLSHQKVGNDQKHQIKNWIAANSNSPYLTLAQFSYAEILFYEGEMRVCEQYLRQISISELVESEREFYYLMSGVVALQKEDYSKAYSFLAKVSDPAIKQDPNFHYFRGVIFYETGRPNEAMDELKQSKGSSYGSSANYYIAKILSEKEDHSALIDFSRSHLSNEKSVTNSGLHQIVGESYAHLGKTTQAERFFEKAINIHPDSPPAILYYQAGIAKFKNGKIDDAIEYFTKSGVRSGDYAKLSAFQLGRLYILRNEPTQALAAYQEASASDDPILLEEAIFQSAMLSAKLGRHAESIDYGIDYLEKFPNGDNIESIQDLIAQSYLKTSNYDMAIKQLENGSLTTRVQKEVYQKVTFQKSMLLYSDARYNESIAWFKKSLKYQMNEMLTNEAYFYLGENYLALGRYEIAISAYKAMSPISELGYYGIGYAHYNLKEYAKAIPFFNYAQESSNERVSQDAILRLGDCNYATKSYDQALYSYDQLPKSAYVNYQKGLSLRALGQADQAIMAFEKITSGSSLHDDALYQMAMVAFEGTGFEQAEKRFTSLIVRYPDSDYVPTSLINRAISRKNQKKINLAKSDYDVVIEKFIHSEDAFNAILGLQELQQSGAVVEDLNEIIALYKKENPKGESLEVVELEAVKTAYFNLDYTSSIDLALSFRVDYPKSKFYNEVSFYLGDSYYRSNQLDDAKRVFHDLIDVHNAFITRILKRLGDISNQLYLYDDAIEYYQRLLKLNTSPKDNFNAMNGLMLAHFEKGNYDQSIVLANGIIDSEWKPGFAIPRVNLLKAKALRKTGKIEEAKILFIELSAGTDRIAAEAAYVKSLIDYDHGFFESSIDGLFDLNARFGSYTYWINQSFLLIAKNYLSLDQPFQAKATLRSIVQHSDDPETVKIASDMLATIESVHTPDSLSKDNK